MRGFFICGRMWLFCEMSPRVTRSCYYTSTDKAKGALQNRKGLDMWTFDFAVTYQNAYDYGFNCEQWLNEIQNTPAISPEAEIVKDVSVRNIKQALAQLQADTKKYCEIASR